MKEVWRPVRGYEGLYEVSDLGRVRSLARTVISGSFAPGGIGPRRLKTKVLKPIMDASTGYCSVMLYKDGGKRHSIHRLVIEAFVGPAPGKVTVRKGGFVVDHINEVKTDNRAVNLRWVRTEWNTYYRYGESHPIAKGRSCPGEKHGCAKLTNEQVLAIRQDPRSQRAIAAEYGMSQATIGRIKQRKLWKHL